MKINQLNGLDVYPASTVEVGKTVFSLARESTGAEKRLLVAGDAQGFEAGIRTEQGVLVYPLTPANAAALRSRLPWLQPAPLGLRTSAGFGDRLGLATPGHVRAVRDTGIAPIFAQQSVRENSRTGRTPQQVMDDATWGAFQAGWRGVCGADADHIKDIPGIRTFVQAGYSFFTLDPGGYVDAHAGRAAPAYLRSKFYDLPWVELEDTPEDLLKRYLDRAFDIGGGSITFNGGSLTKAAVKYSRAVAHVVRMDRFLGGFGRDYDLEISVDETDTPTSHAEHLFIACELKRLGVKWVSLAPRFVGRFEKGVDYIGDLAAFEADVRGHAAIARCYGPYKLGLHSGSDKFSIYPLVQEAARGLVHLKTAGTSYLEALRVLSRTAPGLFCRILDTARDRYETDRASYHVSARTDKVPPSSGIPAEVLPGLLDEFDAREVLHVTFGSVLDRYGKKIKSLLSADEGAYYLGLQAHFQRHLESFTGVSPEVT